MDELVGELLTSLREIRAEIDKAIAKIEATIQPAPAESLYLHVPWVSQLGSLAGFAAGDCSMACVAMVLRSLGQSVTVDDVSRASGLKAGFKSAAWWNAVHAAAQWHVVFEHAADLTLEDLIADLRLAKPVIVILNYQSIPADLRYSDTYNSGHFVVVVGCNAEHVLMHDPYWPEDCADRGAFVSMARQDFERAWSTVAPGNTLSRQALRLRA